MSYILSDPLLAGAFAIMGLSLLGMLALPILPGQFVIWLASLIYGLVAGWHVLGWGTFIILTLLMVIAGLTDEVARWVGARAGGASWKAIAVGIACGLLGMLVFQLPGAILGAVAGIAYVEYRGNKDWKRSFKAAGGYVAGWLASFVVRFAIAALMVILFVSRVL